MALIRYAQPGLHGDKEPEPNLSYEIIPKERYSNHAASFCDNFQNTYTFG